MKPMGMLRDIVLTGLFLLFGNMAQSQVIVSDWLISAGNKGWDIVNDMVADTAGNVYITGSYPDTSTNRNSENPESCSSKSIFVSKYDTSGNLIWMKKIHSQGAGYGSLMAINSNNEILIAGGSVEKIHTRKGLRPSLGFFLTSLSETGSVNWSQSFTGTHLDYLTAMFVDTLSGDIILGGYFLDTLSIQEKKYISKGKTDALFLRFSPSGTFKSSGVIGGKGNDRITAVSFDSRGNMIFSGNFQKSISFKKGMSLDLTKPDETGVFLAKYNPSGVFLSARMICHGKSVNAISLANSDKQYLISGNFTDVADFGTHTLSSRGNEDIYLVCLDTAFNIKWLKQIGGGKKDQASEMQILGDEVMLTGSFCAEAWIDEIRFSSTLNSPDVFVLSMTQAGSVNWLRQFGGKADDYSKCIQKGLKDYIYVAGSYRDTLQVSGKSAQSQGEEDVFVARLENCKELAPKFKEPATFCKGSKLTLDAGDGFLSYDWNEGSSLVRTYEVTEEGKYSLQLMAKNGCRIFDTVNVIAIPIPGVFLGNDTTITDTSVLLLKAGTGFKTYKWSNGDSIATLFFRGYEYPQGMNRVWVQVTNADSCLGNDEIFITIKKTQLNGISELLSSSCILFPNPTQDKIEIYFTASFETLNLRIINQLGEEIDSRSFSKYQGNSPILFNLASLPPGLYTLTASSNGGFATKKIILQ